MSEKDEKDSKAGKTPETAEGQAKKGEEILQVLRKSADFTHELLKENERLRFRVAQLLEEKGSSGKDEGGVESSFVEELKRKLKAVEEEKTKIVARFQEVEKENADFANRYIEIEQENNVLANLYIATYQLHSTLDLNEVLRVILEIVINLVGAEQFGLVLLDERSHELKAVATEGISKDDIPPIRLGEGIIGTVAKTGEDYFRKDISAPIQFNPLFPLVCIPLKIKERVIGVLVIYSLLQQKDTFTTLDFELFNMLAGHSATAIFSSKLYTESERKLSTIQGFIDLLTKQEAK
ncbi:MAG: GAF domain-containing protein [Thermodesulfobacteriota bacterium]